MATLFLDSFDKYAIIAVSQGQQWLFHLGMARFLHTSFLTDHFMKLLAKFLSTSSFCWTSSTFLADRGVISGKDRPRQTDSHICCIDWPDDRFAYLCSLCSVCHNAPTSKNSSWTFWQMCWSFTRRSSLTLCNWEGSTTDLKTNIVFSSVRMPSFTLHAL